MKARNWFRIPYKETVPPKLEKALSEVAVALSETGKYSPRCWRGAYSGGRLLKFSRGEFRIRVYYHHVDELNDLGGGWAERVVDAKVKYKRKMFLKCRYGTLNNWIIECKVDLDKLKLLPGVVLACRGMTEHLKAETAKREQHSSELLESKLKEL